MTGIVGSSHVCTGAGNVSIQAYQRVHGSLLGEFEVKAETTYDQKEHCGKSLTDEYGYVHSGVLKLKAGSWK